MRDASYPLDIPALRLAYLMFDKGFADSYSYLNSSREPLLLARRSQAAVCDPVWNSGGLEDSRWGHKLFAEQRMQE